MLEQSPERVELLVGQRNGTICRGSNVTASGQVAAFSSILSRNESCCKGKRCNLLETHLVGCKETGVYERVRRKKSLSFLKNSSQDEGGAICMLCFVRALLGLLLGSPRIMDSRLAAVARDKPRRKW